MQRYARDCTRKKQICNLSLMQKVQCYVDSYLAQTEHLQSSRCYRTVIQNELNLCAINKFGQTQKLSNNSDGNLNCDYSYSKSKQIILVSLMVLYKTFTNSVVTWCGMGLRQDYTKESSQLIMYKTRLHLLNIWLVSVCKINIHMIVLICSCSTQ